MKKLICALLALCLVGLSAAALAETHLSEVQMIYEDYDDNAANETVEDPAVLQEIEDMLLRARMNPADSDGATMNCTLYCTDKSGEIHDFAIATDGRAFVADLATGKTYLLADEDLERLWEIFDLVYDAMGYDAALFMNW